MYCQFCEKECKNPNSLRNHERLCPENSERKRLKQWDGMNIGIGENQYTKAKRLDQDKPSIKESTRKKLAEAAKNIVWSESKRERHSRVMKKVVSENPESYNSSNRGRVKQIDVDGIKLHGTWELKFYEWCKENSIEVVRNKRWFDYEWNGYRKYIPDFYLPQYDTFVEIKGYQTDRDLAKWRDFPRKLKVVRQPEIIQIEKKEFRLGL